MKNLKNKKIDSKKVDKVNGGYVFTYVHAEQSTQFSGNIDQLPTNKKKKK